MPKFKSSSDIPAPTHMLGCLPHPLASWGLCVGFRRLNSTAPPPQTWAGQSINGQTGKPLALHLGGSHREGAQRGVAIDLGTCRSSAQTSLHLLQILRTRRPGSVSASALEALEWLLSGLAAELMRGLVTLVCYQGSVSSAAQGSRLLLPFCPPPLHFRTYQPG